MAAYISKVASSETRERSLLFERELLTSINRDINLAPAEKHKQLSKARRLMLEQFAKDDPPRKEVSK